MLVNPVSDMLEVGRELASSGSDRIDDFSVALASAVEILKLG